MVPPGERPAPPDALRAGAGVHHDDLVGLLRAPVYVAGVVVGPDRDPRAVGRRRQGVRRPAGAQRAAGHPREPRDVPGRGEPEPVDLLLPPPALERGDVERPVPPGGQRGGDQRPGVPDRRHRDDRDDLAGGRRADHDLRDGHVGRDVERPRRGGEAARPAGLAGSEQPVRHRHRQADDQHHGRGRGDGRGPGRLVPPAPRALRRGEGAQVLLADGARRGAHRVGEPVQDVGHRSSPSRRASDSSPRAVADFTDPWLMPSMAATSATGRPR